MKTQNQSKPSSTTKIVAEVPSGDENTFWTAKPHEKQKVLGIFSSTGAKFVVTKNPPACAQAEGWIRLGDTEFYAYKLLRRDQLGQERTAKPNFSICERVDYEV
jgi:hypothetical protein